MFKKLLMLSALAGSLGLSGSAHALRTGQFAVSIGGAPSGAIQQNGVVVKAFVPALGQFACRYTLDWTNNENGNDQICQVYEARTALHPNCSANRLVSFASSVLTGTPVALTCLGNDANDVTQAVTSLIAGESPSITSLGLSGVVLIGGIFDSFMA